MTMSSILKYFLYLGSSLSLIWGGGDGDDGNDDDVVIILLVLFILPSVSTIGEVMDAAIPPLILDGDVVDGGGAPTAIYNKRYIDRCIHIDR